MQTHPLETQQFQVSNYLAILGSTLYTCMHTFTYLNNSEKSKYILLDDKKG